MTSPPKTPPIPTVDSLQLQVSSQLQCPCCTPYSLKRSDRQGAVLSEFWCSMMRFHPKFVFCSGVLFCLSSLSNKAVLNRVEVADRKFSVDRRRSSKVNLKLLFFILLLILTLKGGVKKRRRERMSFLELTSCLSLTSSRYSSHSSFFSFRTSFLYVLVSQKSYSSSCWTVDVPQQHSCDHRN